MILINIYLLIFCFVILANVFIFFSRHKQNAAWKIYLIINTLIVLCGVSLFYLKSKNDVLSVLADWVPLFLVFFFYQTAGLLSRVFHDDTFDHHIIQFEKKWFGVHYPCMHWSEIFDVYWLSEFLHLCYLSYYFLLYGVPLYFYLRHDYAAFYQFTFAELLILLTAFFTHSIVPVLSPRTIYEKIKQPMRDGIIYRFTHFIVQSGSANGTAFPSTHVAIGTLMVLIALHIHTTFFYYVLPVALGLIICTIYGRFHYVVDMIAGMIYGSLVFVMIYS